MESHSRLCDFSDILTVTSNDVVMEYPHAPSQFASPVHLCRVGWFILFNGEWIKTINDFWSKALRGRVWEYSLCLSVSLVSLCLSHSDSPSFSYPVSVAFSLPSLPLPPSHSLSLVQLDITKQMPFGVFLVVSRCVIELLQTLCIVFVST